MKISYLFSFDSGRFDRFDFSFHPVTLECLGDVPANPPEWTLLDNHRCPHCTVGEEWKPYCPLAVRIHDIVDRFSTMVSHEPVKVEVVTAERRYFCETTAQRGLSSMLGLIIPTSGCPHTAFFRPMARFHLPFSTEVETVYRSTSMYLLAQYFSRKEKGSCDEDFKGLKAIYKNLERMNLSLARRVRDASEADSSVNAVILLDLFAKTLTGVFGDILEELRQLFAGYLE
ncbi:DUF6901 family protein [Salidesulfovibrio onnuriiensis]|uniref:DUF6901 family protein n=1 Tax=Salidesulfovibrio onnuriiensis TaxID=2583823 RepID=UPI0011CA0BFE|nr:hypothetical protein [Salidesulfovibrio onnuriiensis]